MSIPTIAVKRKPILRQNPEAPCVLEFIAFVDEGVLLSDINQCSHIYSGDSLRLALNDIRHQDRERLINEINRRFLSD